MRAELTGKINFRPVNLNGDVADRIRKPSWAFLWNAPENGEQNGQLNYALVTGDKSPRSGNNRSLRDAYRTQETRDYHRVMHDVPRICLSALNLLRCQALVYCLPSQAGNPEHREVLFQRGNLSCRWVVSGTRNYLLEGIVFQ